MSCYINDLFNSFSFLSAAAAAAANPLAPGRHGELRRRRRRRGPSDVFGERAALKLKGYFELAKEEIDQAVRVEEGASPTMLSRTIGSRNTLRIMLESKAVRLPDPSPPLRGCRLRVLRLTSKRY